MKKFDIILIACFIALLVFGYMVLFTKGSECIGEPLDYAVKKYSEEFSPMTCSCSFESIQYSTFKINSSGRFRTTQFNLSP